MADWAQQIWAEYANHYGWDSLSKFQSFLNLPASGQVDASTLLALRSRRCGVPDNLRTGVGYWQKRTLRCYVRDYLPGLSRQTQLEVYAEAWADWGKATPLQCSMTNSPVGADIIVKTAVRPALEFDGPNGIIARAEMPPGDDRPLSVWFDADESWVHDLNRDLLLLAVASHEFGHNQGLGHVPQETGAVMASRYTRSVYKPTALDLNNLRELYPGQPGGSMSEQDKKWLIRLYQDTLGRMPAEQEIIAWAPFIVERGLVVKRVLYSAEYSQRFVSNSYRQYLGREADPGGLVAYSTDLIDGMDPREIMTRVLASDEYYQR